MDATGRKATDEELLLAYAEGVSCRTVGERYGMCPQSVHERLVKLGAIRSQVRFTTEDDDLMRREYAGYADNGKLDDLCRLMGFPKTSVCRRARELGLTEQKRPAKQLRRWKGMSEADAYVWFERFRKSSLDMKRFCKKHGVGSVEFSATMREHFPAEWEALIELKTPRQTMYRIGRALEYRVRDRLKEAGFFVVRSPQSRSCVDLVAIRTGEVLLVQCKRGGVIGVAEWNELYDLALSVGATAIVASCPTGRGTKLMQMRGHKTGRRTAQPWDDYELSSTRRAPDVHQQPLFAAQED